MQQIVARHKAGKLPNKVFSVFAWDLLKGTRNDWERIGTVEHGKAAPPGLKAVPKRSGGKPPELTAEEKRREQQQLEAAAVAARAAADAAKALRKDNNAELGETAATEPQSSPTGKDSTDSAGKIAPDRAVSQETPASFVDSGGVAAGDGDATGSEATSQAGENTAAAAAPPAAPEQEEADKAAYRENVESAKEAWEAGKLEDARDLFIQAERMNSNTWVKGQINKLNDEIGQ